MQGKINNRYATALLGLAIVGGVFAGGCGNSDTQRPANAQVFHPSAPKTDPKTWTADEKIAAVKRSGLPPEQKKAEIERIQSGKD